MVIPKNAIKITATNLHVSEEIPRKDPNTEKINAKLVNERVNPRTIAIGRKGCLLAVEVPKIIGNNGKIHGPPIVTNPANNAKKN